MESAREQFEAGERWVDVTTRQTLPLLLYLAKSGQTWTYGKLNEQIAQRNDQPIKKFTVLYGRVLGKIGRVINQLSTEWQEEIPPPTILICSASTGKPSSGVEEFLERYVHINAREQLTRDNWIAMIDRATDAVHNFHRWDDVAGYFGLIIPHDLTEPEPIHLPSPSRAIGSESEAHLALKSYTANHPELFVTFGHFETGQIEFSLESGDEVDVLFRNSNQTLAVEIKTQNAPAGELTRGIYQCVKYRAVLRAMYSISGELSNVQAVLVTPQSLPSTHRKAARRLRVPWQQVKA